jgi:Fe-S-cluster containining protein
VSQVNVSVTRGATGASPCQTCGACCCYSREWPRFTTEADADIARISSEYIDDHLGCMRCNGDRCSALVGVVGASTSCAIYAVRPEVCRACEPGDDACQMARQKFGLPPVHSVSIGELGISAYAGTNSPRPHAEPEGRKRK